MSMGMMEPKDMLLKAIYEVDTKQEVISMIITWMLTYVYVCVHYYLLMNSMVELILSSVVVLI